MKRLFSLTVIATAAILVQAQSLRTISSNTNTQLNIERVKPKPTTKSKATQLAAPRYTLYRDVARCNTWIVGVGDSITDELARHLPYYYRLSMRNHAGHYQFVEAMHGDTLTARHPFGSYMFPSNYSLLTDSIAMPVGQWLLTSDLSGEYVVEERAYEPKAQNANLVYAFQTVMLDPQHFTGSYIDSWGLPIDIAENDDHYYGSVVSVTLSSHGNDSIVDYIDGKGLRRYVDGNVDQRRYEYDSIHRLTSAIICNMVGNRIENSVGVCGQAYIYDAKSLDYTITNHKRYYGGGYNPVPLYPQMIAGTHVLVLHDEYGRIKEQRVIDKDGNPTINAEGQHRICFEYDNHGNVTAIKCFDINGNIAQ